VADFAKMMMDQHGSNLNQILEMANKAHIKALNGGLSNKLTTEANEDLIKLGGLQGEQFEKAYVDAMVKGHEAALGLIDNKLMKEARTELMKQFLSDTRTVVAHHLESAKKLQESMKS
jgi:putative membrane protein